MQKLVFFKQVIAKVANQIANQSFGFRQLQITANHDPQCDLQAANHDLQPANQLQIKALIGFGEL